MYVIIIIIIVFANIIHKAPSAERGDGSAMGKGALSSNGCPKHVISLHHTTMRRDSMVWTTSKPDRASQVKEAEAIMEDCWEQRDYEVEVHAVAGCSAACCCFAAA